MGTVRVGWHLIGYDLPLRRYGVYFAYVAPEPVHVHLGFEWGVFMSDPQGLLQGEGVTRQVRWLTFEAPDEIEREAMIALVRDGARVAALTRGERLARAMDRRRRPRTRDPPRRVPLRRLPARDPRHRPQLGG